MSKKFFLVLLVIMMVGSVSLAYTWPTGAPVTLGPKSDFGPRPAMKTSQGWSSTDHMGIDVTVPEGTPCLVAASGTVTKVVPASQGGAKGMYVLVDIGSGYQLLYQHLSASLVSVGDKVKEGQVIAKCGSTGNVTGAHIHFEVWKNGTPIDPVPFLNSKPSTVAATLDRNYCKTCGAAYREGPYYGYFATDENHFLICSKDPNHMVKSPHSHAPYKNQDVCTVCKYDKNDKYKTTERPKDTSSNLDNTSGQALTVSNRTTCSVTGCGGQVSKEWYLQGNMHYRVCLKDKMHQFFDDSTKCTGAGCKLCPLTADGSAPKTTVNVTVRNISTCYMPRCGGKLSSEWFLLGDQHYRVCLKDKMHHIFDDSTKCTGAGCSLCRATVGSVFTDLPDKHWAKDDIAMLKNLGIVNGIGDGKLNPDGNITAKDYITLLTNVANKKGATLSLITQDDLKLVLGDANTGKLITREMAAALMGGMVKDYIETPSNILGAKDWNNVTEAYKVRINKLAIKGIFKGSLNPDGSITVNPKDKITRVEAMALVSRLYQAI